MWHKRHGKKIAKEFCSQVSKKDSIRILTGYFGSGKCLNVGHCEKDEEILGIPLKMGIYFILSHEQGLSFKYNLYVHHRHIYRWYIYKRARARTHTRARSRAHTHTHTHRATTQLLVRLLTSWSGGVGFKSQPADRMSWDFLMSFAILPEKFRSNITPMLDHDRSNHFLSVPCV